MSWTDRFNGNHEKDFQIMKLQLELDRVDYERRLLIEWFEFQTGRKFITIEKSENNGITIQTHINPLILKLPRIASYKNKLKSIKINRI